MHVCVCASERACVWYITCEAAATQSWKKTKQKTTITHQGADRGGGWEESGIESDGEQS